MDFFRRADGPVSNLGILPGTFNPPTIAHLALAEAASPWVDEVIFVLPRNLPHKEYSGASFDERIAMLRAALENNPRYSIAAVDRGLFVDIADELRIPYGVDVPFHFLCGRDAAERIASWDYGQPGFFAGMLRKFHLLVAAREGEYEPPAEFRNSIQPLVLPGNFDPISATEVRRRVANGEPWKHLVPAAIHAQIEAIYR